MAKFPTDLFSIGESDDAARERIGRLYERMLGLARWFHCGLNGIIYPQDPGEARLDASYVTGLLAGANGTERERIEQFAEQLHDLLNEHALAFEGAIEIFTPDTSPDVWSMVKVAYVRRPFWKWY